MEEEAAVEVVEDFFEREFPDARDFRDALGGGFYMLSYDTSPWE